MPRIIIVGDIQGCFKSLMGVLAQAEYNPKKDRLYLAGDLVNRGPRSLQTLQWAHHNQKSAQFVLGNHDLHLLACAAKIRYSLPRDTIADVLESPDRDELVHMLRQAPFAIVDDKFCLVHAGIHPKWTKKDLVEYNDALTQTLRGNRWGDFLKDYFTRQVDLVWTKDESPDRWESLIKAAKILSFMRVCSSDGRVDLNFNGSPSAAKGIYKPWFVWPSQFDPKLRIVFGHWSALGFYINDRVTCLDSGCVWGETITAWDVVSLSFWQQKNIE